MPPTLRKLKDEAQRQYVRGRFDRSAALYWEAIRIDPADPQLRLKHAEACRRANLTPRAIDSYRSAANLFLRSGHEARAQSTLKMALELAPRDTSLHQALASFSERPEPGATEPVPLDVQGPNETRQGHVTLETFAVRLAPLPSEPEVRRLSEHALAIRKGDGWLVVRSESPLRTELSPELPHAGEGGEKPDRPG